MSENLESLNFKIGLSGTYFAKKPEYEICVNDKILTRKLVESESDEIFYEEFVLDLVEAKDNKLIIKFLNKESTDTITEDDNDNIVKDTLLNIHSIEIDEIDLDILIWNKSVYKLDSPQIFNGETVTELTRCVNLGWNGSYIITFDTPFYLWLLDNL